MSTLRVILLIPLLSELVFSITLYLPANSRKCLKEDIHKDVLVSGQYEVSELPQTMTNFKITDSMGDTLYTKENATKGKFSFITGIFDQIEVCFKSSSPMGSARVPDQLVKLNIKHDMVAKNPQAITKEEKLTPLEAQLTRLEHLSQSIADGFTYLKKRGTEMRQTNTQQMEMTSLGCGQKKKNKLEESTNTRILLFSIISICCFLALATWQIFYLRRFFKTKKLID